MANKRLLIRLIKDNTGNVLVVAALSMPIIIGFAGLATDTVQWTLDKRNLQRTADSAALAGAYSIAQKKDAIDSASRSITSNNALVLESNPVIENAPTSGAFSGDNNAVSVSLNSRRSLAFSNLFLDSGVLINARATAAVISNGDYCVISLDESTAAGVQTSGNAAVDLKCGIFANSRSQNAVTLSGSSTINTDIIGAVGGLSPSPQYVSSVKLLPYSVKQPDPFGKLPSPVVTGCTSKLTVRANQTINVTPGCYRGVDIAGTANFSPGIYYIDGNSLSFGPNANAMGTGVTFILTSSTAATNPSSIANINISGGATLNFSAPTSGTYAGVLFYQDRRAPSGITKVSGSSSSKFEGAIYFPRHSLQFTGDTGFTTDCVQIIALRVTFTGNTNISNVCPTSGAKSFRGAVIRLVT